MNWDLQFTHRAAKQAKNLNLKVQLILQVLIEELKITGPAPGKHWHHYGKLHGKAHQDLRHCHLKSGNPTYVCCWEVLKSERVIEIYYVGTHEKAPY
jgi:mRNA-degrading endonuclease RelE of RelBE toxin-antitoxin system